MKGRQHGRKSKQARPFKRAFFGYGIKQVEEYCKHQASVADASLSEQRVRIEDLKAELKAANTTVAALRERENSVNEILFVAADKANELETDLKIQYALEIERLKIFQAKWTNAYDTLKEKYAFEAEAVMLEALVVDTSLQLEKALLADFGISLSAKQSKAEQHFKSECERLRPDGKELYSLIDSLKKSLNPPESELQDIEDIDTLAHALNIAE